ncbi:hypothetical protein BGLA2_1770010 [Burkholderia gladioli]|nr:hypothetical protein BGLA2_1770010 [Burkholderia gladioli]
MNQGSEDATAISDRPREAIPARSLSRGGSARALRAIVLRAPNAARRPCRPDVARTCACRSRAKPRAW